MANIFEVKYSHISTVIYVGIKCRLNESFVKILYCSCDISRFSASAYIFCHGLHAMIADYSVSSYMEFWFILF